MPEARGPGLDFQAEEAAFYFFEALGGVEGFFRGDLADQFAVFAVDQANDGAPGILAQLKLHAVAAQHFVDLLDRFHQLLPLHHPTFRIAFLHRAAGGAVQESDSEGRMVQREELVKPIQQINEVLRRYGVEFQLSEDSGRTIIRLIDRENGELIRQIPPEEALNAAQRLEEVKGRLFSLEV